MTLSLLFGLKVKVPEGTRPMDFPKGHYKMVGSFSSPDEAINYVFAGGIPPEYPYYAVSLEEGAFWVVGTQMNEQAMEEESSLGLRPTLLAGPFDDPRDAVAEVPWTDPTGFVSVSAQCSPTSWTDECPKLTRPRLTRPNLDWAESRIARWEAAQGPGPTSISLSETAAIMRAVGEWLDLGIPGSDLEYEERALQLMPRVRDAHLRLREAEALYERRASEARALQDS